MFSKDPAKAQGSRISAIRWASTLIVCSAPLLNPLTCHNSTNHLPLTSLLLLLHITLRLPHTFLAVGNIWSWEYYFFVIPCIHVAKQCQCCLVACAWGSYLTTISSSSRSPISRYGPRRLVFFFLIYCKILYLNFNKRNFWFLLDSSTTVKWWSTDYFP